MELIDLRAIAEGCDVDAVEFFGGETMLECTTAMNEVMTGATDAAKVAFSDDAKEARREMKLAKAAAKNNQKKEASEHIKAAIKACEKVKEAAKDIDDDGFLSNCFISLVFSIIPYIGGIAFMANHITGWLALRDQSDKGNMKYSNRHPERQKNLVLEWLFGGIRAAGYSRAMVLQGIEKMIDELKTLEGKVKDMKVEKEDK